MDIASVPDRFYVRPIPPPPQIQNDIVRFDNDVCDIRGAWRTNDVCGQTCQSRCGDDQRVRL